MRKPTRTIRKIFAQDRGAQSNRLPLPITDDRTLLQNFIQERMTKGARLSLGQAIRRFAQPPHQWHPWHTVTVLARFIADGGALLKARDEVLDFTACADMVLDKDAWDDVRIVSPSPAPRASADILPNTPETDPNAPEVLRSAAPRIQAAAREWRRRLIRVRSRAGNETIETGRRLFDAGILLDELIRIQDPVKLMARFREIRETLADLQDYLTNLEAFCDQHLNTWLTLLSALNQVAPHRAELEKDPETAAMLSQMDDIAGSPRPFEKAGEIDTLIAGVDQKHKALIARRRAAAMERIDRSIADLTAAIETHRPPPDLRNRALYPLRAAKRRLAGESDIARIRDAIQKAEEHAEEMIERIEAV